MGIVSAAGRGTLQRGGVQRLKARRPSERSEKTEVKTRLDILHSMQTNVDDRGYSETYHDPKEIISIPPTTRKPLDMSFMYDDDALQQKGHIGGHEVVFLEERNQTEARDPGEIPNKLRELRRDE